MSRADILSYRVALETVDAALPLFKVDWVGGKIPVDDGVAPPMEIDTLLPDGR